MPTDPESDESVVEGINSISMVQPSQTDGVTSILGGNVVQARMKYEPLTLVKHEELKQVTFSSHNTEPDTTESDSNKEMDYANHVRQLISADNVYEVAPDRLPDFIAENWSEEKIELYLKAIRDNLPLEKEAGDRRAVRDSKATIKLLKGALRKKRGF